MARDRGNPCHFPLVIYLNVLETFQLLTCLVLQLRQLPCYEHALIIEVEEVRGSAIIQTVVEGQPDFAAFEEAWKVGGHC